MLSKRSRLGRQRTRPKGPCFVVGRELWVEKPKGWEVYSIGNQDSTGSSDKGQRKNLSLAESRHLLVDPQVEIRQFGDWGRRGGFGSGIRKKGEKKPSEADRQQRATTHGHKLRSAEKENISNHVEKRGGHAHSFIILYM